MQNLNFIKPFTEDIKSLLKEALLEFYQEQETKDSKIKLYSLNKARKLLGKSYVTVQRMVQSGVLKTTADGKYITESELRRYLNEK